MSPLSPARGPRFVFAEPARETEKARVPAFAGMSG
jgi:hypothetical protein